MQFKVTVKIWSILAVMTVTVLHADSKEWYRNDEMAILYEALTKISSESLYRELQRISPQHILENYIYKVDEYGDYFTKEEYQAFKQTLSQKYAGIGMVLYQQKRDDRILCIPASKELESMGVVRYDQLISVDGHLVKGKNFYVVSSWIRGRKNSSVTLKLQKASGELYSITLKRTMQHFHSVVQRVLPNGIVTIQIIRFMKETPEELRRILQQWPKNIPIVIDLRGNGGGDLFSGIQSADLLLPKGSLISSIETTKNCSDYRASNPDYTNGQSVLLLQDGFTASAAEVFIAALTQNHRAESIGEKSFGKGVAQKFVFLSNGDALLLTYGKIITPNGESYHKKGLLPTTTSLLDESLK
jgi:carboxyl-terminal processing protease